ncbi:hypothetical protein C8C84_3422 [Flavobacterium sp. 102]|nr:hypothetical protein C8C84_3422 [Flavobacterium sp. 102]
MKFLFKKTSDNELKCKEEPSKISKMQYFLNQFLIWIFIFLILMFVMDFLNINTNLNE